MSLLQGFPPVADVDAHTLILGSMPGVASLRQTEYYAHERNAFWPIMKVLFSIDPKSPYAERLQRLQKAGVALWDVIGTCERYGSLDNDIVPDSIRANDFPAFFAVHPKITRVFFNGSAAEAAFRRHVLPLLPQPLPSFARLPSTSPAHAARNFQEKLSAWSVLVAPGK